MLKLTFKENKSKAVGLDKTRITIGRDPANDVVLDDDGISGFHAEIVRRGDKFFLLDLKSTNGTLVNGVKLTERHEIRPWDQVKFDTIAAEIVDTGQMRPTTVNPVISDADLRKKSSVTATAICPAVDAAPRNEDASGACLVVVSGPDKGKRFPLKGTALTLGRTPENNIVIDEATVSSAHARLVNKGGRWRLEDSGSSNGTFVNSKKISSRILDNDDQVRLGKAELRFENAGAAQCTVVMPAVDDAARTVVMPAVDDATRTSVRKGAQGGIPAWVYGLGGFVIVCLAVAAFFLFGRSKRPNIVNARPQGGKVWSHILPGGRKGPTTPVLADVNGNGFLDVITGDAEGYLVAMDGAKGLLMFDTEVMDRILAPPVAVDLTKDGRPDIVVATNSGIVLAYDGMDNTSKLLWASAGDLNLGAIYNRPVVNDLNNDGVPDIIVPTSNKGLVALDGSHGWELWNTAALFGGEVITAPVMADVNGDGIQDYIAVSRSGRVVAITGQDKRVWKLWATETAPILYASPLYLKIGDKGLIVVATAQDGIFALHAADGRMAWRAKVAGKFFASPVAADANGDKIPDVVCVTLGGDIHVLDGRNGDEIWSLALGAGVRATPALFDVNNDGLKDLIIPDMKGVIHIVDMNKGRIILNLDVPDSGGFTASPLLGDINNDGLLDIITAGQSGRISAWFINRETAKGKTVWPRFLGK